MVPKSLTGGKVSVASIANEGRRVISLVLLHNVLSTGGI